MYRQEGLDRVVLEHFRIPDGKLNFKKWNNILSIIQNPKKSIKIAICGKYIALQ